MLTDWVNAGGNLIAMRPDKQLAGLLGLTAASTTLANGYLLIDTAAAPGAGIVSQTMQFHGTADRYTLTGATAIATLYSNADHGDRQSGGHRCAASASRRAGGRVHLRPRALGGLHAAGQSGLGRPGARRHRRRCARTTCSSAPRRRSEPDWIDLDQGGDPAGGRAAAAAGQPDSR